MKRVLITGVSGYIGLRTAEALSRMAHVDALVGVDVREPARPVGKLSFCNRDVRSPVDDIIRNHSIDTVVHAAFILPPIHDARLMNDVNVNGTRAVLDSCVKGRVRQVLYTSSATAYGFHADNDRPLTEESPLRGNDDVTYARAKRIIEGIFREYEQRHPEIAFTVLRPCFVVGPGFDNPLARYVRMRIVPVPLKTAPLQFVHEDDLVEIICRLLEKKKRGVYNVAGAGVLSVREMVRMLGNTCVPLPYGLTYVLNGVAWALRLSFLSEFPSPYLQMIRHSWVASTEKLTRELGYALRYDTVRAFDDFVKFVKSK